MGMCLSNLYVSLWRCLKQKLKQLKVSHFQAEQMSFLQNVNIWTCDVILSHQPVDIHVTNGKPKLSKKSTCILCYYAVKLHIKVK